MPSCVNASLAIRAAAAMLIGALVLPAVPDVDLWGHTLFGGDIFRTRGVPTSDPYSFTSDVPWINHEWASELFMYASFAVSGGAGLVALRATLIVVTLAIVARAVRREGASAHAIFTMLAALALVTYPRTQHVRPQLFSLVAFAALLATLLRYDQTRSWRSLVPTPFVMLAWANLHGGFLVGLVPLGAWGLKILFDRQLSNPHKAAAAAILSASAPITLINPYGVGLWQFLWNTVGLGRADITEWWSVTQSGPGVLAFWLVTTSVAAVIAMRSPERPAWHRALLVAGLAYASFRVSRLDAFFAIATAMAFGRALAALMDSRVSRAVEQSRRRAAFATAAMMAAIAGVGVALLRASSNDGCRELPTWLPDQRSAGFVAENRLQGRILVFFNWGEFVMWHFAPDLQVSTDGRRETVYSDRHIRGHLEVYNGSAAGVAYLRELDPDYVWLPRNATMVAPIEREGWTKIIEGERSVVLARRERAAAAQFVAPRSSCFETANARPSPIGSGFWRY